jgi:hypothetical protein
MTVAQNAPDMKSKSWRFWLLKIALVLSLLGWLGWYFFFRGPVACSDVPVTTEVGWWAYQDRLDVTDFTAQSIGPRLNLFAHDFVVRFHVLGKIHAINAEGWRPAIKGAQLTVRVTARGYYKVMETNHIDPVADVMVVPIVTQIKDTSYKGEDVSFDLKLEHVFSTMDWGPNHYDCRCGDKAASVTVFQGK